MEDVLVPWGGRVKYPGFEFRAMFKKSYWWSKAMQGAATASSVRSSGAVWSSWWPLTHQMLGHMGTWAILWLIACRMS
jgi:hypothetical protein